MIDLATITRAVSAQLTANSTLMNLLKSRAVDRSEVVNDDPSHTPWLGVYRGKSNAVPRTLGKGAEHWQIEPRVRILVQATSSNSGEKAEDLLESIVKVVIDTMLEDPTIGNTVDMIVGIDWDYIYLDVDTRVKAHMQTAIINLTLEARSS